MLGTLTDWVWGKEQVGRNEEEVGNQRSYLISLKCLLPTQVALGNSAYKCEILRSGESELEFGGLHMADSGGEHSWRSEVSGTPTFRG